VCPVDAPAETGKMRSGYLIYHLAPGGFCYGVCAVSALAGVNSARCGGGSGYAAGMTELQDVAAAEAAARALLAERVSVIGRLVQKLKDASALQEQADAAQREAAGIYRDAVRLGWTTEELRKLGITEPSRRPAGRPRKSGGSSRRRGADTAPPQQRSSVDDGPQGSGDGATGTEPVTQPTAASVGSV